MAASAACRWFGSGPECAAYIDAGAGPAARGAVRLSAFPFGLLSILSIFASVGSICHDPARPARSAGPSTGLHDVLFATGDFNFGLAAQADPASELGADHLSWLAAAIIDARRHQAALFRLSWPDCTREGRRSSDFHCSQM